MCAKMCAQGCSPQYYFLKNFAKMCVFIFGRVSCSPWIFVSHMGFSLVAVCRLTSAGSVVVTHGLGCSLSGILVPRPRTELESPALQGRFLTTGPAGKSPCFNLLNLVFYLSLLCAFSFELKTVFSSGKQHRF